MKKLLTIVCIIQSLFLTAQTFTGQAYVQQTVMGVQKGIGLRMQNAKNWGIGIVSQSNLKSTLEGINEKYPFYGVEIIAPLTKCGNMQFFLSPKVGFVNENFFIVIPEVETELKVTESISAAITAGIRARQASTGIKVLLHI